MTAPPVILLEFNELSPQLLDRWIDAGDLPNFKRLRDSSTICVTEADELGAPNLEPWIQWYSLHTGLPFKEHGVFRLSEGAKLTDASVWDILLNHGMRVMNFSSMNCRGFDQPGSVFLPDPWNDQQAVSPGDLAPFGVFLKKAIQEQSNARWGVAELAALTKFLVGHGLRASTVAAAVSQVVSEKTSKAPVSWKRVHILDRILLDVFAHYYDRERPQFATFFSNSTAHLQHAYWRYLEPAKFSEPVSDTDSAAYGDAVKYGYQAMDLLLERMFEIAGKRGARLMFATALSQQAYTAYEGRGGRHYYRPHDVASMLRSMGVTYQAIQPVMAHQYILTFSDAQQKADAMKRIDEPHVNGRQLFDSSDGHTPQNLIFGSQVYAALPPDQMFTLRMNSELVPQRFFDHFYELDATKSGGHHPDGCFWVQTGEHRRMSDKVSILDVAPTILGHFGLSSEVMRGRQLHLN